MMKQTIVASAVAAVLGSGLGQAAEPASPHTLTGNVGIYSQYIFRGLTQTNRDPALQGGFDYSHSSGFYLGTWGSNISWLKDGGSYSSSGSLEWDFYGGYKWGFAPDWTLDVGGLYYYYPGDTTPGFAKADTFEVYAGLSWKWLSGKFSYATSNKVFGVTDANGTYYVDLGINVPLGDFSKGAEGWTIFAHYGIQKFTGGPGGTLSNDNLYSYNDWKLGVSYALPKDFTIGAFYSDTSSLNNAGYGTPTDSPAGPYPNNLGKGTGTVYIQKTF